MFKKALLIVVVSFIALVVLAVAVAGVAATAGLATAAAVISESGVVEAFEDVADGAERMQIELQDNSVTFTNPDSGESRTIVANERFGRGRVQFDLPEVIVKDADRGTVIFAPGWYVEDNVRLPEITITDPDTGQSRVIVSSSERAEGGRGAAQITVNGRDYGSSYGLRFVGEFIRGLFVLAALVLIGAGAFVLLRNRNQAKAEMADNGGSLKGDDIN